jgi:hypothetical protein
MQTSGTCLCEPRDPGERVADQRAGAIVQQAQEEFANSERHASHASRPPSTAHLECTPRTTLRVSFVPRRFLGQQAFLEHTGLK